MDNIGEQTPSVEENILKQLLTPAPRSVPITTQSLVKRAAGIANRDRLFDVVQPTEKESK